jgi:hypothetical protein
MRPLCIVVFLLGLCLASEAKRGRRRTWDASDLQDFPSRAPTKKEAADSGASNAAELARMPWLPTHNTRCGDRLCRPGEGNLKGYKMWAQPYIHREAWVQAKSRRVPHLPDPPSANYAALVDAARKVREHNLVVVTAADFDFREIVFNWHAHLNRLGISNALVLAMDRELAEELGRRRIAHVDNSANLDAWNATCLQRHIQRVRTERMLAVCALLLSGIDVLHTDATVVLTKDVLPMLRTQPPFTAADLLVQRESGPAAAYRKVGSCVNPGFLYARGAKDAEARQRVLRFFLDLTRRGLVEFYNRWNNVIDQMGFSFLVADTSDLRSNGTSVGPPTSQLANETTLTSLSRYGLRLGFLPYDQFPRVGDWSLLRATAAIHHLVADGSLGKQFEQPWGVLPFRGHRQRLDRYDEEDFAAYVKVMRQVGLWLVDS